MTRRLLLMLLLLSQAASANPMWEQWKAEQAFRQGRFKEAITGYQRALKQTDSPRLRYNLALAQTRAGDLKNARTGFAEVLEGDDLKLRSKAAYNLGNMAYKEEKLEEALDYYKKAVRYDEKDEDARHNAWVVLQKLKQKQQQQQKQDKQDEKNQKDQDKKDDKSSKGDQDKKDDKSSKGDQDKKDDKSSKGDQDKKDDKSSKGDQDKKDDKSSKGDQDKKDDKSSKDDPKGSQAGKDKKDGQDPAGSPEAAARARKQEAEQLLHFFEDKEKQETGQRARARVMRTIPQTGGQTW